MLLAGALLLCHGVFGVVHLICDPPQCVAAGHAPGHRTAHAGAAPGAPEHPAGHGTSTEYFAVLAGLLGLLLGLLPKGAASRVGIRARRPPGARRARRVQPRTRTRPSLPPSVQTLRTPSLR